MSALLGSEGTIGLGGVVARSRRLSKSGFVLGRTEPSAMVGTLRHPADRRPPIRLLVGYSVCRGPKRSDAAVFFRHRATTIPAGLAPSAPFKYGGRVHWIPTAKAQVPGPSSRPHDMAYKVGPVGVADDPRRAIAGPCSTPWNPGLSGAARFSLDGRGHHREAIALAGKAYAWSPVFRTARLLPPPSSMRPRPRIYGARRSELG